MRFSWSPHVLCTQSAFLRPTHAVNVVYLRDAFGDISMMGYHRFISVSQTTPTAQLENNSCQEGALLHHPSPSSPQLHEKALSGSSTSVPLSHNFLFSCPSSLFPTSVCHTSHRLNRIRQQGAYEKLCDGAGQIKVLQKEKVWRARVLGQGQRKQGHPWGRHRTG